MTTFLLTWNATESGYATTNYTSDIRATAAGRTVSGRWTFGSRRSGAAPGDRVFLLRQRRERGIVSSGTLVDGVIFPDAHWQGRPGRITHYAEVCWDHVLPVADRLPIEELLVEVPGHHWNFVFASGQEIRPDAAEALEKLWAGHLDDVTAAGRH